MTAAPTMMTIYHRDGRERSLEANAASREIQTRTGWSAAKPPPLNWEREVPKYKVTRDIQPAAKPRYRTEPPFASMSDSDVWQYGTRVLHAGEIIETTDWPHASFRPLNHTADRVLAYFNSAMKSRLPLSAFHGGQVRLDDGLTGSVIVSVASPRP